LQSAAPRTRLGDGHFQALDDVTFSVDQGEVVGIIGHNGAGKSTMLKLLAGVTQPTRGQVSVRGRVAPLIEVGAGLVPELTGRENVFLNAAILGMKRSEIRRKFDEIVSFAELEQFIDTPIKRYSSGMQIRLGFAIATSVEADVLIVDEVLAVGDLSFQRRCFDRMEYLIRRQGKTVLLVSHNLRQVERLCDRVLMLEHGRLVASGPPREVCDLLFAKSDRHILDRLSLPSKTSVAEHTSEVDLLEIKLLDLFLKETVALQHDREFTLKVRVRIHRALPEVTFGFGIHTTDFLYLTTHNSETELAIGEMRPGEHEVHCRVSRMPLLPGVYSIRLGITSGQAARAVFYAENLLHFQVVTVPGQVPATEREGFVRLDAHWDVIDGDSAVERLGAVGEGRPRVRSWQ
jgi:ABC-type polysaccharide/polyol phosphate transport system ATPase subunit